MAKLVRHVLLVLGTLAVLAPWAHPGQKSAPFRIKVADRTSGHGLPDLRATVEDGTTGDTKFDGSLLFWLDTALMSQTVRFTIEHHGVLCHGSERNTGKVPPQVPRHTCDRNSSNYPIPRSPDSPITPFCLCDN
jgi:hypothetical protein